MGTRGGGGDGPGAYSTPTEWKLWNQTRLSASQLERLTAERLVAESKRLRDDVGNRVTTSRREVIPSKLFSFQNLHQISILKNNIFIQFKRWVNSFRLEFAIWIIGRRIWRRKRLKWELRSRLLHRFRRNYSECITTAEVLLYLK